VKLRFTRRHAVFVAVLAAVAYIARGLAQLLTLGQQDLKYDFGQSWGAGVALNHGQNPYAEYLRVCGGVHFCPTGYVYPPLYAEILRPLGGLPLHVAGAIWLLVMHACVVATIVVLGRLVSRSLSPATTATLLAASLLFFPLWQALYFIQIIPFLALLLSLAATAYVHRRDDVAGGILGFGAALRVSPLLIGPALLVRREQWRRPLGVAAMVAVLALFAAIMAWLTPYALFYLRHVAPTLAAGSAELDNQSPDGILMRLQVLAPGLLPVAAPRLAQALTVVVVAVTWWLARGDADDRRRALVFAAFLAATPLASTLTEPYHFTTELVVFALAAASLPPRSLQWWLALVSYPLLWIDGHVTNPIAIALGLSHPSGWRIAPFLLVTGTNLAGALALWAACAIALRRTRGPGGLAEDPAE